MKIGERHVLSFDWLLMLSVLALTAVGLMAIWSTTDGTTLSSYFGRQLAYAGLGFLLFLVLLYFDYHVYSDYVSLVYAAAVAVLGLVLLMGSSVHGNKSWIPVASFAFQPSEFVKLVVVVALAKYYSESERDCLDIKELLIGGVIVLVPMALVVLQHDLGTAVTFLPIYVVLSFVAGVKRVHLVAALIAAALAVPVVWMTLQDYQKGRIQMVLSPEKSPRGLGYQALQSEIAIGSGRFLGKGFRQGTQGQLGFLPARHTDFVFAVWAEERGFLGSVGVLSLFFLMSIRLLRAAREAKDRVGGMIVMGVLGLILFHVMINVGMVVGLMPIAGIPLPFVSAGGSSLISCFAAISICANIRMRRYVN